MIRSGPTTYFIDVRQYAKSKCEIIITESRFDEVVKIKSVIRVFNGSIEPFRKALEEAASVAQGK